MPNQFFGLLYCILFLFWCLKSDILQINSQGREQNDSYLSAPFFLSSDNSGLCSSFFFRSLHPFWINVFNIPLAGLPKLIFSFTGLWLRVEVAESSATCPLICLGFFLFITSISFFFVCLSQWQKKRINYFYEASTSLCVKVLVDETHSSQERAFLHKLQFGFCKLDTGITEDKVSVCRLSWQKQSNGDKCLQAYVQLLNKPPCL